MDEAVEQRLAAAGEKIAALERRGQARAAARLRSTHERVGAALARLRRANAEDWSAAQADAEEALREMQQEMREVDKVMLGWHEEEVEDLDR